MTATPKPGTVANITISTDARNLEPMTYEGVFYSGWHNAWISQTMGQIHTGPNDIWTVTDVRPLVVLDLSDAPVPDDIPGRNEPTLLVSMLRESADSFFSADAAALARKVADQIEAQTKPPRISEPGWGAVVEAGVKEHAERLLWTPNDQGFWACRNPDEYARNWGELVDPVEIRAGIEDGAR